MNFCGEGFDLIGSSFLASKGGYMKKITAVLALGICFTVLIVAGYPRSGDAATIYGCQGKIGGFVRIVASQAQCDTKLENPISWNSVGPQGAQGPIGATGPQGPQGPKGDIGSTGATGATGAIGPAGPAGAAGPQGATGAPGAMGPTGAAGKDGAAGPSGKSVLNGIIDPEATDGTDGDFYVNTTMNTIFGPKTNGVWPTGAPLVGPAGATGPKGDTGATGSQGAQGLQGPKGDQGIQGLPGTPGLKGDKGDQGLQGPQGDIGPQGIQGIQGIKGDTGPAGPAGSASLAALNGTQCNASDGNASTLQVTVAADGSVSLKCPIPAPTKIVFLTSKVFNGAMRQAAVIQLDLICQSAANQAGLNGSFKTWIEESFYFTPSVIFTQSPNPYVLVDGTVVADNWTALTTQPLQHPIDIDEYGNSWPGMNVVVWTNLKDTGVSAATSNPESADCDGWTSSSPTKYGNQGYVYEISSWSYNDVLMNDCSTTAHLYCFQQ
jgi:hypothetical protein